MTVIVWEKYYTLAKIIWSSLKTRVIELITTLHFTDVINIIKLNLVFK